MKLVTKTEQRERLKRNEEKWSQPLMAAGWTALPSVILERQQGLGLDPLDLNILLQLARHWWFKEQLPCPSKKVIAECVGVKSESTIRKRIAQMEKDGLIRREARYKRDGGQLANYYHFDGLIKAATPYAQETIETRKRRKAEDAERRRRKRPKLRAVPPGE